MSGLEGIRITIKIMIRNCRLRLEAVNSYMGSSKRVGASTHPTAFRHSAKGGVHPPIQAGN